MHLFGSSVINKIVSFLGNIIIVRLISKADYGVYSNANNILSFFCLLESFGMSTTLLQYGCVETGEKKKKIWEFCFTIATIFNVLLCIAIFFTGMFAKFSIEGTGHILMLMSFLPLARSIGDLQRVYMRTEFLNKEYARTNNVSTIVTVVLTIILSYWMLVNGMILATYLSAIIVIIYICVKYKINIPKFRIKVDKSLRKEIVNFSLISMLNNSTSSIMYLLDTFVLGVVVAQSVVTASYKVATTIPTALAFIPTCVMLYIYPHFAKKSNDTKWCMRNYKRVLFLFGGFNLCIVSVLFVFAPLFIRVIFGAQYLDVLIPFRILCINYFFHATFRTVPGQLLVTQKKLGFNTFVGFASSILNTILNLVLIPKYSAIGAALATFIVTFLFACMSTTYLYVVYKKQID